MSYNADICKLVIKNVENVEEAMEVLDYTGGKLWESISQYIKENIRKRDNFASEMDEEGDISIWETSWPRTEDDTPLASFSVYGEGDGLDDRSWISIFCGLVPGTIAGLFFWYEWEVGKKEWKKFLKDFYIKNPELRESGFSLNADGTAIVFPLKFDLDCLAENFPDLDDCFESLNDALEAICAQRKTFDKLIEEAGKFGE